MRSASAVAFVICLTVRSSLGSDPSEAALEAALQHDDSCANSDDSKCSVELLQRAVVEGRVAESVEAEDVDTIEEGQAQADDEVNGPTGECCRWGNRRTCTKQRHCQNGHCTTKQHCSNRRYCTSRYRQRRTCTKQRHCQNGHCTTQTHCSNRRYCSSALLQEGEAATENDLDANEGEGEEVIEEDGSADAAELLQEGEAATDNDHELDANEGESEEVIEEDGSADAADAVINEAGSDAAGEVNIEESSATVCKVAEQGTRCDNDDDCKSRTACCQDVVAKKIGVKPCFQCDQTCHPTTHKCKCN